MPLRTRLTLLTAGTVALTVVLASLVCYFAMRGSLRAQVDDALQSQEQRIDNVPFPIGRVIGPGPITLPAPPPSAGGSAQYVQALGTDGELLRGNDGTAPLIAVTARDRRVARGDASAYLSDRTVEGDRVRVNTVPIEGIGAIQLGRSLEGVDSTLSRLRLVLILLCVGGTALAAALGRVFSRAVMQPVTDLTEAAEHISATEDLARRIDARGDDEVGRMAARFNTMLDTLAASRDAERRLVADASHELRTPVTSLRTNIEVLLIEGGGMPEGARRKLLEEVSEQTEELGALITDVIELARGEEPLSSVEDVKLDDLVAASVARVSRHHPETRFETDLEPTVVEGLPDRLDRAIGNLLDNAAKYGPHDGLVEVTVRGGEVAVRDHGPGVPPADAPLVFDRFYRGDSARGRAGSGLGLAIVRQVAEAHGGSAGVQDADGGGARFWLRLPSVGGGPSPVPRSGLVAS
jgi:two-component system sensor histidine kinase MprB